MSRHSTSSRHRSQLSRGSDASSENTIDQAKAVVNQLNTVMNQAPHQWEIYLPSARSAMTALDRIRFFRDAQRYTEQVWILHGLQDFAFHDPDEGAIRDVAEWCQAAWLRILRNYPDDVETLTGVFKPHMLVSIRRRSGTQRRLSLEFSASDTYPDMLTHKCDGRTWSQLAAESSSHSCKNSTRRGSRFIWFGQ
jgi:hypothetical protein